MKITLVDCIFFLHVKIKLARINDFSGYFLIFAINRNYRLMRYFPYELNV